MKIRLVLVALFLIIAIFASASGEGNITRDVQRSAEMAGDSENLARVLAIPSPMPRGPQDVLKDYEGGMTAITEQFSARLQAIVQGVQSGRLSRQEGEHISGEQYQIARMQYELLSSLHAMLQQDLARATVVQAQPTRLRDSQTVTVALPFSSLQLSPSLAQYLDLSPDQISAIERLMSDERRRLEPLIAQMQATKTKLLAASTHRQTNKKEIHRLAAEQARLLMQLIVSNSQMQARLYELLSAEQQRKLDKFKQSSEHSLRAAE